MTGVGEVEGDHGRCAVGVSQGALDEPGIDPGCEQVGGLRMPEGMDGDPGCGDPSTLCGCAAGALDTGAAHGAGSRRTLFVVPPGGRKEPGPVPVGSPGGPSQSQGLCGQGHVPVWGALTSVDRNLSALAVNVGDLQGEGFVEPESHARDRGEGDLIVQGGGSLEQTSDVLGTEDGGEAVCGVRAHARQGVPVALEDIVREEPDATGAETHRSWRETIDIFSVQEGGLKLRFGEQVRGLAIALSAHADFTDRGLLGPFACATELECGNHVLT